MEHPCAKCGASVIDGLPFCPQCKSPQIRVPGFEVELPPSDDAAPAERAAASSMGRHFPPALQPHAVVWHLALPAAALGGLVSIAAMFVPFAALGPAYALGGAAAVFLYRLRLRTSNVSSAAGVKIGASSGGFGFAILAIFLIGAYVYHEDGLRSFFSNLITLAVARGSDPQSAQQVHELLKTHEGLGAFVAFLLSVFLFLFLVASSLGGAMCASWLRRR